MRFLGRRWNTPYRWAFRFVDYRWASAFRGRLEGWRWDSSPNYARPLRPREWA